MTLPCPALLCSALLCSALLCSALHLTHRRRGTHCRGSIRSVDLPRHPRWHRLISCVGGAKSSWWWAHFTFSVRFKHERNYATDENTAFTVPDSLHLISQHNDVTRYCQQYYAAYHTIQHNSNCYWASRCVTASNLFNSVWLIFSIRSYRCRGEHVHHKRGHEGISRLHVCHATSRLYQPMRSSTSKSYLLLPLPLLH